MPETSAPARESNPRTLNLEFLRNKSKSLLRSLRAGDEIALSRFAAAHPHPPALPKLADAQLVIARETGFSSWVKLKHYVESVAGSNQHRFRAIQADISYYHDRAEGLRSQHESGLTVAAAEISHYHPRFSGRSADEVLSSTFNIDDAHLTVAREHGQQDWEHLVSWLRGVQSGETVEPFREAFKALEAKDNIAFVEWLMRDPTLLSARGTNGNSLLSLSVSLDRVECVRLLLEMGADVDLANVRGWTPLHAAAYSNRVELIDRLLAAGARPDLSALGDGGTPLVVAEFWGNRESVDRLKDEGIYPKNLRAAAGAGDIELLSSFFDKSGVLRSEAGDHRSFYRPHSGFPVWTPTNNLQEIINEAFVYAAKNGRIDAMSLLLRNGAAIDGDPYRGTALTWAAATKNCEDSVTWLLEHGADVNCRATFGGLTHGKGVTALHLAAQTGQLASVQILLEHGADRTIVDSLYQSDPAGWAEYGGRHDIARLLRED